MTISVIGDWMQIIARLDGDDIGKFYNGFRSIMCTVSPGNVASANFFYLHTLCMNYCVIQHAKLPLWPLKKLGIERLPGTV